MKKIRKFLVELKPNTQLWQIFWISFTMICAFIFMSICYLAAGWVEVGPVNGFKVLGLGIGQVLFPINAGKGAVAFIRIGSILGYIPFCILIFPLVLKILLYILDEKIINKFPNVVEWVKWSRYFLLIFISATFAILGFILYAFAPEGYKMVPILSTIIKIANDDTLGHIAGTGALLILFSIIVGSVVGIWTACIILAYVFEKIAQGLEIVKNYFKSLIAARQESKALQQEEKLRKKEQKKQVNKP